jgi:hypothetical protein
MNGTPMRRTLVALMTVLSSIVQSVHAGEDRPANPATLRQAADQRTNAMKIRIKAGDKVITATLVDNATSRDFVSLLPLELTLQDYAATEKIGYLPRKLASDGAPPGSEPVAGDISYYAPWGNLAVFYRGFATQAVSSSWERSTPAPKR